MQFGFAFQRDRSSRMLARTKSTQCRQPSIHRLQLDRPPGRAVEIEKQPAIGLVVASTKVRGTISFALSARRYGACGWASGRHDPHVLLKIGWRVLSR